MSGLDEQVRAAIAAHEPEVDASRLLDNTLRRSRTLHRRRAAALVTAVAAAVAVVLGLTTVVPRLQADPPPPAGPSAPDPRDLGFTVGWMPPGLELVERSSELRRSAAVYGKPGSWLTVELFGPGVEPPGGVGDRFVEVDINGTAGRQVEKSGPAAWRSGTVVVSGVETAFYWRAAPDRWAAATGNPSREDLLRVARSVRVGAFEPVTSPFRVGYVPASLRLARVGWSKAPETSGAGGGVHLGPAADPGSDTVVVDVSVYPLRPQDEAEGRKKVTTTVGGRPAWTTSVDGDGIDQKDGSLWVYVLLAPGQGLAVSRGGLFSATVSRADVLRIAASVESVAPLDDRSGWVADPLR